MLNNERNAGRKKVPNGIKKQFVIPKENLQEVTDIVKSFQDSAILKEKINNLKK